MSGIAPARRGFQAVRIASDLHNRSEECGDTGNGGGRCCQDNGRLRLVRARCGSPETMVSNHLSAS
jgi:hypothetical protein